MKKFLALSLLLVSGAVFVPSVEAKSNSASSVVEPQISIQLGQNRRNRRINNRRAVRTYTRNVRQGRAIYRETYRIVYRPNGTTRTQLVSRVRVGRY